jgi:biotin carboxyl carrier protein
MKHRTAISAGERVDVAWNESENTVEATVNGRTYQLEKRQISGDAWWFGWNGLSVEVLVSPQEQGYSVLIRGHRVFVEFLDSAKKARRRTGISEGVAEVRAPMPGKIVRVLRGRGDAVEAHQGIVVMEAMKMQNEIRSPKPGKVVDLRVAEGDAVKLGDLIAQVE